MPLGRMMRLHHVESPAETHEAIEATDAYIQWNERTFLPERKLPLIMPGPDCGTFPIVGDKGQAVWLV